MCFRKALLTTSCTHALEMSALLLELKEGDEVIVPSFTFVSTINAFVLRGARPVFIDIRPDTLNIDETKAFVDNAFRDGSIPSVGTAITKILPPVSRFNKNNGHAVKKQTVLDKLGAFFERFFGLI